MSIEKPKYDAAISFLSEDEKIARAIYDKLKEGFEVFFFPENQRELAGTDGQESMRTPFLRDSRVIVVLYRDGWGKTKWTRVEETAIKEACFDQGWERLFFVMLDTSSKPPTWLPKPYVRLNFESYGLEQAVGAIKARIQEQGGQLSPLTPARLLEKLKAEEAYRDDKARLNSETGMQAIFESVSRLFEHIKNYCEQLDAEDSPIDYGGNLQTHGRNSTYFITDGSVSLGLLWERPYRNNLDGCRLVVSEYNYELGPGKTVNPFFAREPLNTTHYFPDLSFAREYGWKKRDGDFLTSTELAEKCVMQFLHLTGRNSRGEVKRDFP